MIVTLMVFVVLSILSTFSIRFMVTENKQSMNHQYRTQAYYIARGAAEAVEAAIFSEKIDEDDDDEDEDRIFHRILEKLKELENQGKKAEELVELDIDGNGAKVTIEKEKDSLVLISKAEVNGVEARVEKLLKSNKKIQVGNNSTRESLLDTPIYAKDKLKIEGNPTIKGGTIVISENCKVSIGGKSGLEIKKENRVYPLIGWEKITNIVDKDIEKSESDKPGNIKKSTHFTKDVTFNGITIETNDKDIDIIVDKKLTLEGKKELNISGKGKVRIFIKGKVEFSDDINFINKDGNSDQLQIIYLGDEDIEIKGNPQIHGNIFINKAEEVEIGGNPQIHGNIFINKAKEVEIKGNPDIEGLFYAPNSKVEWEGNGSVHGLIAKEIIIKKNPNIYPPNIDLIPQWIKEILGGKSESFTITNDSYYRN